MSKGNGGTRNVGWGSMKDNLLAMQAQAAAKIQGASATDKINVEGRVAILMDNGYSVGQAMKRANEDSVTIRYGKLEVKMSGNTATVSKVSVAKETSIEAIKKAGKWNGEKLGSSANYEKKEVIKKIDISTNEGVKELMTFVKNKQK